MSIRTQEQILRFQVSVDNVVRMEMAENKSHLCAVDHCLLVRQELALSKMSKELSSGHIFEQKVKINVILEGLHEVDNERVLDLHKNATLGANVFHLLEAYKHLLIHGLQSKEFSGTSIKDQTYATKSTGTYAHENQLGSSPQLELTKNVPQLEVRKLSVRQLLSNRFAGVTHAVRSLF